MTFWYNSFGAVGSVIQVVLKTKQSQNVQLFTVTTNSSALWQRAKFSVGAFQTFSFMFKVVFPRNAQNNVVAFDDISFTKCAPSKRKLH